jgi:hypothetical protein
MSTPIPTHQEWEWLALATDAGDILTVKTLQVVTFFGGMNDPEDNGETASGVSTRDPAVMGCALPGNRPHLPELAGSPVPASLPFKTMVRFWNPENNRQIEVPYIDLGPALYVVEDCVKRYLHRGADLTIAAFKALGGDPDKGSLRLKYRILGAAKYAAPPPTAP